MSRDPDQSDIPYYRRSRRAAWVAAGVCGLLGATAAAETQHDHGFAGLSLTVGFLSFVWGLDYHRRLAAIADRFSAKQIGGSR
ncbi:hypothetical protein [Planctomycetes bacterium K23_9]|uniref:Uncharacterized protein n=1 Tax=Stieleria marina TaxID=1930275 RepID=A0A517NTU4_9BACT|nr:hypothetical protein K239x_25000 [Planctomycetes bacterium K23_9]